MPSSNPLTWLLQLGRTALQLAFLGGHDEMAQSLIQYLDRSRTETPRSPIALSSRADSFWLLSDPVELSVHSETPREQLSPTPLPGSEEDDQEEHRPPQPNQRHGGRLFRLLPRGSKKDGGQSQGHASSRLGRESSKKEKKAHNLKRLVGKAFSKARKLTMRSGWRANAHADSQPQG